MAKEGLQEGLYMFHFFHITQQKGDIICMYDIYSPSLGDISSPDPCFFMQVIAAERLKSMSQHDDKTRAMLIQAPSNDLGWRQKWGIPDLGFSW